MADHTTAVLFGVFFKYLAEEPDERAKAMAYWLYRECLDYDFSYQQMGCDEALVTLGLATKEFKLGRKFYRYLSEHYEEKDGKP